MKKIIKAIVPTTKNVGTCLLLGTSSYMETAKQNILWQYNKLREHDGFPPVKRMPGGTVYAYETYLNIVI
jgi:hypothetical protein